MLNKTHVTLYQKETRTVVFTSLPMHPEFDSWNLDQWQIAKIEHDSIELTSLYKGISNVIGAEFRLYSYQVGCVVDKIQTTPEARKGFKPSSIEGIDKIISCDITVLNFPNCIDGHRINSDDKFYLLKCLSSNSLKC